jgi:hypothetical protein
MSESDSRDPRLLIHHNNSGSAVIKFTRFALLHSRHAAMKMMRHVPALKYSDDEIPIYYGYKWVAMDTYE